jgi:hypothetical protein
MNSLIIHPEYLSLKNILEELKDILTERIAKKDDLIFHECKNIETVYMLKIGYLEFKIFEIKLNIRKIKKEVILIQKQINLQKDVDLNLIRNQIEIEFEKYILELEEKGAKLNIALNRTEHEKLSKQEAHELQKIYRELILKLHPDLNDTLNENEKNLFFKVMEAYESADLNKLKVLKVLASDTSKDADDDENSIDKLKNDIDLLEIRLGLIDKEIDEIKNSYPYTKKDLLIDNEKLEKNKEILEDELINHMEILNKYKKKRDNLLKAIDI